MSILQNYLDIKKEAEILKSNINLIVVTKGQYLINIKPIINEGHLDYGENRVQEALLKWSEYLKIHSNINLHLIGKLQSNKAKDAIKIFNFIHSLDNENLANTLAALEVKNNKKLNYFIQINISNEPQKNGVMADKASKFIKYCTNELKLNIIGLMCLPPAEGDPDQYFRSLAELARANNLKELSMGMSNDYKCAIKNGATFIRVGSKIFRES